MLSKSFNATMKTIVRSPITWAAAALMLGVVLYYSYIGSYGTVDLTTYETIMDRDPRFVIEYNVYIQHFLNTIRRDLMYFGIPLFCVIVTGIVLARDWRDNFYEVEHAGNIHPSTYFFGRFFAVSLFLNSFTLIMYIFSFHLYVITRGGVPSLTPWEYFFDSNVRLLREFFITGLPGVLVFSGVTFVACNITKSGTIGTSAGIVYVIFEYLAKTVLARRMPQIYKNFFTPTPSYLYQYWAYYDTEWFDVKFPHNPFTTGEMLLCLGILYSAVVLFAFISYICIKRRKV